MKEENAWVLRKLMVLAATVIMAIAMPLHVAIAVDTDGDGFDDAVEMAGITLSDNLTSYPPCDGVMARASCLDPVSKDLFVILVRATQQDPPAAYTNIPTDPLAYFSVGGVGVYVHEIGPTQVGPDRAVTSSQKAVRITESLDPVGQVLGLTSSWGTPNGLDLATIYTQRIINFINTTCANASECKDKQGATSQVLYEKYIRHVIAHEMGHNVALTNAYNERFGGHHYKAGTTTPSGANVIMDQSVIYTNKGGKVTYYIGEVFTDADKQGALLR